MRDFSFQKYEPLIRNNGSGSSELQNWILQFRALSTNWCRNQFPVFRIDFWNVTPKLKNFPFGSILLQISSGCISDRVFANLSRFIPPEWRRVQQKELRGDITHEKWNINRYRLACSILNMCRRRKKIIDSWTPVTLIEISLGNVFRGGSRIIWKEAHYVQQINENIAE